MLSKLNFKILAYLIILLLILPLQKTLAKTSSGMFIVDTENRWGHNQNLNKKASYILCDGYIGSPLIFEDDELKNAYINNCEITPPSGSIGIIDTTENISSKTEGYPAYSIKFKDSEYVYFVCDGFLSSSAWCSKEASKKAEQLIRATSYRNWEQGAKVIRQSEDNYESKKTSSLKEFLKRSIRKSLDGLN